MLGGRSFLQDRRRCVVFRFMSERLVKSGPKPWRFMAAVIFLVSAASLSGADGIEDAYLREQEEICCQAEAKWWAAKSPGEGSPEGDVLVMAAIHADRPDLVDGVLSGGDPLQRRLSVPLGSRPVRLRIVHEFKGVQAQFSDEMFASIAWQSSPKSWLARRITKDAIEMWTPKHGWLFDGRGRLQHEARPSRGSGWGREWYGAFLPNGRWITTDVDEMDGTLRFFSASGKEAHSLTCEELAPRPADGGAKLIGWARSDREGKGWVVNVGSEGGWATVWVGPTGPPRVLKPGEQWNLCYPRAFGPRGTWLSMSVPDDAGQIQLSRGEASHGPGVGFPVYGIDGAMEIGIRVAGGKAVFGFWPGRTSFFIGAERYQDSMFDAKKNDLHEAGGWRTRKLADDALGDPTRIVDKTWFFDADAKVTGWVRARRIGDAADGRSMLFRNTFDGRIITMGPDLRIRAIRRFIWSNGTTADAVVLWDDLRLGVFIHHHRLILAKW